MENKVIIITQARFGSTRLPGKVLMPVGKKTLLQVHLERLIKSKKADKLIVATTNEPQSQEIAEIGKSLGLEIYHGSQNDVLDRFYHAAAPHEPDYVVRVTSDCPLIDPSIVDECIAMIEENSFDYVSNVQPPTYPDGVDVEVFTFGALKDAWEKADTNIEREHVTPFIRNNTDLNNGHIYKAGQIMNSLDLSGIRLTVDEQADYDLIKVLIEELGDNLEWKDYVIYLLLNTDLLKINSGILRNEGYLKSLEKEKNE